MFGLNEISWRIFIQFIVSGLLAWYAGVLVFVWLKTKSRKTALYEESFPGNNESGNLNPISVSSKEFPDQIISAVSENRIPFEVLRFEEDDENDGINLNLFLEENNGELTNLLPEIQYQQ